MELATAKSIATELVATLAPACVRIEIAGGIRRGKAEPHDIEIVCIPNLERKPRLEFGRPPSASRSLLDSALWELERAGRFTGRVKDGNKYKQLRLREEISLDLFIVTPPAQWGIIFTIRTGPGSEQDNFSRWIVTPRSAGGALPSNLYISNGAVWLSAANVSDDQMLPTPEESDFFKVLGLEWLEPSQRHARWNALPELEYVPPAAPPVQPVRAPSADIAELMKELGPGVCVPSRKLKNT